MTSIYQEEKVSPLYRLFSHIFLQSFEQLDKYQKDTGVDHSSELAYKESVQASLGSTVYYPFTHYCTTIATIPTTVTATATTTANSKNVGKKK